MPRALSPAQQAVVDYRGGHLQVIACAGSGKTETISRRVAALIAENVKPSEIVAFTFMVKAAEEMKERIARCVSEVKGPSFLDRLGPLYVGSIHAYCLQILQLHVPRYAAYDMLDEHQLAALVWREYSSSLGLDRLKPALEAELRRIKADKDEGLRRRGSRTPRVNNLTVVESFLSNVDALENELLTLSNVPEPMASVYRAFLDLLERHRVLTFGQCIVKAVEALRDPQVHGRVHGRLKHLVVDEYQDINPAQEALIRRLAESPVTLCVVGDDDQAIYQWRGSQVQNILTFEKRYLGVKCFKLLENYRSQPKILKWANGFVSKKVMDRFQKQMRETRPADYQDEIQVLAWGQRNDTDEAELIARTISDLTGHDAQMKAKNEGRPPPVIAEDGRRYFRYRDIAVLLRSVASSGSLLIKALEDRNIPVETAGRSSLFNIPEIASLAKVFLWLVDAKWYEPSIRSAFPIILDKLVHELAEQFGLVDSARERLHSHLESWRDQIGKNNKPANFVAEFYDLLACLGVGEWDVTKESVSARLGNLAQFSRILADFEAGQRRGRFVNGEYTGRQDRGESLYKNLAFYIGFYARRMYDEFGGEPDLTANTVKVLTIHAAKGLEWPVVFMPCLVDNRFPSSMTGTARLWLLGNQLDQATRERYEGTETDEARLFYVAMTRARDMLLLSRFMRTEKQTTKISRFLNCLISDVKLMDKLPVPSALPPDQDKEHRPVFSFSELASYETCPLSFRLRQRIGFMPPLVEEMGMGKSVHHVMRRLAEATMAHVRHEPPSLAEAEALLQQEFYVPFARKPAFAKLRSKALEMVTRYLTKYQDDLRQTWEVERPFELYLENGILVGRADAILNQADGTLTLVDYKTRHDKAVDQFQLAIYAEAGRREGLGQSEKLEMSDKAYVHDLSTSDSSMDRREVDVGHRIGEQAAARAVGLIKAMRENQYQPKPEPDKCKFCDMRAFCGYGHKFFR